MKAVLKITPVRFYAVPKYPAKKDVNMDMALLRSIPRRWKAKPAVCMALALTLSTGLYGCVNRNMATSDVTSASSDTSGTSTATTSKAGLALSIPVFAEGAGRGSYGCVSVAPPVFLSEEEALQVIREEAKARGVDFSGTKTLEGKDFPATKLFYGDESELATWQGKLELDGFDSALDIGFEFVSEADVVAWAKKSNIWSSVEVYDMKGTAERLADVVENTAVFYDPAQDSEAFSRNWQKGSIDFDTYVKQYTAEQKVLMLEQLREQVRDFLAWLAAEGII